VILSSGGVKNVLNRSFMKYKLPHSVRFRLAWTLRENQNSRSCKGLMMRYGSILIVLFLAACGGSKGGYYSNDGPPRMSAERAAKVPDAVVRDEPLSASGNSPYRVYDVLYRPVKEARGHVERGEASWYGTKFHGRRTSSGEIYDMYSMTAAHKTLPLPSYVRVTNLANRKSVVVRVNDRGPFLHGRILDVSYAAAAKLDMVKTGTANVEVKLVTARDTARSAAPVRDAVSAYQNSPAAGAQSESNSGSGIRASELEDVDYRDQGPAADSPTGGVSSAGVWFQVGAFGNETNAKITRDRLSEAGFLTVRITSSAGVNGKTLHRVRLGPFTEENAGNAKTRLEQAGYTAQRIVE
jgi:rare lipoprotein A